MRLNNRLAKLEAIKRAVTPISKNHLILLFDADGTTEFKGCRYTKDELYKTYPNLEEHYFVVAVSCIE